MRDISHKQQIERWARFILDNPETWKAEHTKFINGQVEKANSFYERLRDVEGGEEILQKLRMVRVKGYSSVI
jgi:hypothetical protein